MGDSSLPPVGPAPTQMMAEREALAKWLKDTYAHPDFAPVGWDFHEDADALLSSGTVVKVPTREEITYIIACRSYPYYAHNKTAFDKDLQDSDTQAYRAGKAADAILSLLRGR